LRFFRHSLDLGADMHMPAPYYVGQRVRVIRSHTRALSALVGHEGVVDSVPLSGVIVILDSDPAHNFRVNQMMNYESLQPRVIRRFFLLNDVEPV
jgi:hypothetical protein